MTDRTVINDPLPDDTNPDCPECGRPGDLAVDGGKNAETPDWHCVCCGHRFDA